MSVGIMNGLLNTPVEMLGATRIGCALSAGIFSVLGWDGSDLSSENPAYLTIPNRSNPLLQNVYTLTANQSFQDKNGSSSIIGNLFGTDTGVAWATDIPFYLYAVINDAEDTPVFGISRVPNMDKAPAVGDIGTPTSVTANNQYSLFIFEDIVRANYDANPVVCLGSFRMQKDASDDWTVQSFSSNGDGIGKFQEGVQFTMPTGVRGASSGSFFQPNGGTAPIFNTQSFTYWINKNGMCFLNFALSTVNAGTPGVGAVQLTSIIPLDCISQFKCPGSGNYQDGTNSNAFFQVFPSINSSTMIFYINEGPGNAVLNNEDFQMTNTESLSINAFYPIKRA